RLSRNGSPVYHYSFLSTFAEAAVVPETSCVPIPTSVPFDVAALVGCAVSTGVGAVWRTAEVRPGDRVAIFGCGGVGLSAVLGAPAVQIPRAERRILGSAYGSVSPHRDFAAILALHADGRLPLERLITHRLPLRSAAQALDLVRQGIPVRAVLDLDAHAA